MKKTDSLKQNNASSPPSYWENNKTQQKNKTSTLKPTPNSKKQLIFLKNQLSDWLKKINLPSTPLSIRILQYALLLDKPLPKEHIQKIFHWLTQKPEIEKLLPLFFHNFTKNNKLIFEEIEKINFSNFSEIFAFCISYSDEKQIFLPINKDRDVLIIYPEEEGFAFQVFFHFSVLETVFVKGYFPKKKEKKGEIVIYFMPFLKEKRLKEVIEEIQKHFSHIYFSYRFIPIDWGQIDGWV